MKYWFLDSLRWIAILIVVFSHIHFTGIEVPNWWQNWAIWVSLFFIVSAYTICLSQEKSNQDWKTFFQKRFFRIYPLFFLIITIIYILYFFWSIFWSVWENINPHLNYFLHLSFLYGFHPNWINSFHLWEWSLFSEAIFYLLFPIFWYITKNSFFKSIILTLFLYQISKYWTIFMNENDIWKNFSQWWLFVYYFPLKHLFSFSLGILIFHIHNFLNSNFSNKIETNNNFFSLKIFKIILFLIMILWSIYIFNIWQNWKVISFLHTNIYFFFLVLSFMIWNFKIKILEHIWKISYSLYLLNLPIIFIFWHLTWKYNLDKTLATIFAFVVLFFLANQTYKFEIWGINLRKKVFNKLDNFWL